VSLGCSKSEEPPAATAPEATTGAETATATPTDTATTATESVVPTQPDTEKFKAYVTKIQYPATREQVLAASEQSPDFTASEKKWVSTNLPEGSYTTPEAVLNALKVQ
jgi:hypothetical protein